MNQYILSKYKTVTMLHGDSRGLKTNQLNPGSKCLSQVMKKSKFNIIACASVFFK